MRVAQLALLLPAVLSAQRQTVPPDLAAERADFARWLETSPVSPYRAIYHQPFDGRLVMGPAGEPALASLPRATLSQDPLRLTLETAAGRRTVPRNRDVEVGDYVLRLSGERGRSVVTVFGPPRGAAVPDWYGYAADLVLEGTLSPPARRQTRRLLGLDGIEVEASLAGTFVARLGEVPLRLTVYRMPEPGTEESELMIFFRDSTNGRGTYPAGRFLSLRPLGEDRYRADFNRARNPFCAYNGIFPCPLPWDGNAITRSIEAGERYQEK